MKTIAKTIKIDKTILNHKYDSSILTGIEYSNESFTLHREIAQDLKNRNIYTVTVIIDNLNPLFWNNKKYVKKTKIALMPLYKKLLYQYFFDEFGDRQGHELYAKWLKDYKNKWQKEREVNNIDDYIVKCELELRYRKIILKKYKNHKKLFSSRFEVQRKRYYNLPQPLNHIDWRNPYDNIFIWENGGKKFCYKGGSGSSGGRGINSKFIFGLSLINKTKPIPSYLFLYSNNNELHFIKKFSSLAVPSYDIGSNYFLDNDEQKQILSTTKLLSWKDFDTLKELNIV